MLSEPPATKPRRNWHLLRWSFLLIALTLAWGAWKEYDFRKAVKEAKELGWTLEYTDPVAIIDKDWRDAFRKDTWNWTWRELYIPDNGEFERHFDVIRRLKPNLVEIHATFPLRDLSELNGLSNLTILWLFDCPKLTNIDALKDMKGLKELAINNSPDRSNIDSVKELENLEYLDLSRCSAISNLDVVRELHALERLTVFECTGLKNVDGILGLAGLSDIDLRGCDKLTEEAVNAVKAALPKASVISDYGK